MRIFVLGLCLMSAFATGCATKSNSPEPLPSWKQGGAQDRIIRFIETATGPSSPGFVPVSDRVAVFDHDGTLMVEKPGYIQQAFLRHRLIDLAAAEPTPAWASERPFAAIIDSGFPEGAGFRTLLAATDRAKAGLNPEAFDAAVRQFVSQHKHPQLEKPAAGLVYRPMLDLIELLHAKDFTVFIVSASNVEFLRPLAREVYDLPSERIIGSVSNYDVRDEEVSLDIVASSGLASVNAGTNKVLNIQRQIGVRPILAVGNSDGDLAMLRYATSGSRPGLAVVVNHDDQDREYRYDDETHKVTAAAAREAWLILSMKEDFLTLWPQ